MLYECNSLTRTLELLGATLEPIFDTSIESQFLRLSCIHSQLSSNLFQWSCLSNWCDYITLYTVQVQHIYICQPNRLYITPDMTCCICIHKPCFMLLIVNDWLLDFILQVVNSLFNILLIGGNKALNWIVSYTSVVIKDHKKGQCCCFSSCLSFFLFQRNSFY